jgi:hypothetical protein
MILPSQFLGMKTHSRGLGPYLTDKPGEAQIGHPFYRFLPSIVSRIIHVDRAVD